MAKKKVQFKIPIKIPKFQIPKQKSVRIAYLSGAITGVIALAVTEKVVEQITLMARLSNQNGKSLYTLGQLYARRIDSMRLSSAEAEIISQGMTDWVGKKMARVDYDENRPQLQNLMETRLEDQIQMTKKEGQEYIKKFLRSGGFQSLSGLAYRVILPGSQKKPSPRDWVEVSYEGKLVNGQVIDASNGPNGRVSIPMNGVISGWSEGLQLVGEGGEIELAIPSELAYGDAGTSTQVPPGATLIFKIQLHRILPEGPKKS